jgi:hypothetical protein
LNFIAELVKSLAWPVALLACILLLRRHLLALLPLIRTVKYSDVEIRFGQEIADLKKTAENSDLPKEEGLSSQSHWETLVKLSDIRPRSAIRGAWQEIERSIKEVVHQRQIEVADAAQGMPMVVGAILLNKNVITVPQYQLMQKLRLLYHESEQAPPDSLTSESASEYVALALRLAASINSAEK